MRYNKAVCKLEAHDAAGVETDMIQPDGWGEYYDDGYGNHVSVGDLSVQRMMERGGRTPWETTVDGEEGFAVAQAPQGYDTDPILANPGKVEKVMHEYKEGELHSSQKGGPIVTNRKQAVAIALSEARKK